jgi:hypothetical protein
MFKLEDAISQWRRRMAAAGIKQAALDELEEHLRADVEQQTRSGLDVEAAFSNAVARIGSAALMREEFKKVRPRPGAPFEKWISAGAMVFVAFALVFCAKVFYAVHMSVGRQVFGFAGICLVLVITCGWRHALRCVPVISGKRARFGTIALGGFMTIAVGALAAFGLPAKMANAIEQGPLESAIVVLIWTLVPVTFSVCLGLALMMNDEARAHWGMTRPKITSRKDGYV